MFADTGRLTALFVSCYQLFSEGKRDAKMRHSLLQAMQLFKENRLQSLDTYEVQQTPEPMARREETRRRIAAGEADVIFREILERLSSRTRISLRENGYVKNIRDLLIYGNTNDGRRPNRYYAQWEHTYGIGPMAHEQIRDALAVYGLYIDMSEDEVKYLFSE